MKQSFKTNKLYYGFPVFILKIRVAGVARNWVVPRINTFVPVM